MRVQRNGISPVEDRSRVWCGSSMTVSAIRVLEIGPTNMLLVTCHKASQVLLLLLLLHIESLYKCSDWEDHDQQPHGHHVASDKVKSKKDRVLLKDVKTLTFQRHRRTTSRRTHSIHQLSCVGGTAGCKLFTPDVSNEFLVPQAF